MQSKPLQDKFLWCIDLSATPYQEAWTLQTELVSMRRDGRLDRDVVLMLEHPPVFTLGRHGRRENLKVGESHLYSSGIQVIRVERGGDITYHGPGQLVVYPIVDLRQKGLGVADYVYSLEEVMIRTAADFQVTAARRARNRGVWVGDRKLGSVGIAVRRGVTFHGFALNVDLPLGPFEWINPCGMPGARMTSLDLESSEKVSTREVRSPVKRHMGDALGASLHATGLGDLLPDRKRRSTA